MPRQPGQDRKVAATTSPTWVVVQPLTMTAPRYAGVSAFPTVMISIVFRTSYDKAARYTHCWHFCAIGPAEGPAINRHTIAAHFYAPVSVDLRPPPVRQTLMTDDRSDKDRKTDWAGDRSALANERTFAGWMRTGMCRNCNRRGPQGRDPRIRSHMAAEIGVDHFQHRRAADFLVVMAAGRARPRPARTPTTPKRSRRRCSWYWTRYFLSRPWPSAAFCGCCGPYPFRGCTVAPDRRRA